MTDDTKMPPSLKGTIRLYATEAERDADTALARSDRIHNLAAAVNGKGLYWWNPDTRRWVKT